MSKRELVEAEIERLSDQDLDRLLVYIRALAREQSDRSLRLLAAESALAKDWLTSEEDQAWANL